MSRFIPSIFKQPDQQTTVPTPFYKYKTRFSMLGTVGSGKTTISALTVLTAQTLSANMPEFKCRVLETTSGILEGTSNLRRGRFPPKTYANAPYAYESGLLIKWEGRWREKNIHIPICDLAGEDIQLMIQTYKKGMYDPNPSTYGAMSSIINYVKKSDGFILCVPASKALLFTGENESLEKEPGDLVGDPDVNLYRILSEVISHKEITRGKPIKGIAVVITKWDLLAPFAVNMGMDLYDPTGQGLTRFMDVCFPSTSMLLKNYGLEKVEFFPSYVQVERNDDGTIKTWNDKTDQIKIIREKRLPQYSESSYVKLIEWLKSFAT